MYLIVYIYILFELFHCWQIRESSEFRRNSVYIYVVKKEQLKRVYTRKSLQLLAIFHRFLENNGTVKGMRRLP